jgi:hypothetical protein
MRRSIPRHSQSDSDLIAIPVLRSVDVDSPDRVIVGRRASFDDFLFMTEVEALGEDD